MLITKETLQKFKEVEDKKHTCSLQYATKETYQSKHGLNTKKFMKLLSSVDITLEEMQEIAQNQDEYELKFKEE